MSVIYYLEVDTDVIHVPEWDVIGVANSQAEAEERIGELFDQDPEAGPYAIGPVEGEQFRRDPADPAQIWKFTPSS